MGRSISAVLSLKDNMSATLRNVKREQSKFQKETMKMRKELEKTWRKKRTAKLNTTSANKKMKELKKKYAEHRKKLVKAFAVKDLATRKIRKIKNNIKSFNRRHFSAVIALKDKTKKVLKSVKKKLLGIGKIAGALAIGGAVVGIKGTAELDEGSAKVKSIAGDKLNKKDIKKGLLTASNKTGVSTQEVAETQYSAISSGVDAKDSLQASITASKLAKAGFTDSDSALKIMTSTMNVYGITGQKAMQSISDKLLVVQNKGVTTVEEMADSMGSLTPVAKSAGVSIDEMMAGMASLTKNGLKTDEAVTSYKGVLTSVIKPSDQACKMAQQLGIDFSVAAIKSKGFGNFLQEIKEKTHGNTEQMGQLFGNVRGLTGALVLTGKGNKDFATSLDAVKNSAGSTDEAFNIMHNTLGEKFNMLKNLSKNALTTMFSGSSETLGAVTDRISNFIQTHQEGIASFGEIIGNGVGTALDKLISFGSFVGECVGEVKGDIVGLVKSVTGQFSFLKNDTGFLKDVMKTSFHAVTEAIKVASKIIVPAVKLIWNIFKLAFPAIKTVVGGAWKVISPILTKLGDALGWVADHVGKLASWLGKKLSKNDEKTKTSTGKVEGSHFNGLSYVPHDGYIARLHQGERVLTAQENKQFENNTTKGNNFNIVIQGTNKSTKEIVDELVPEVKLAIDNLK